MEKLPAWRRNELHCSNDLHRGSDFEWRFQSLTDDRWYPFINDLHFYNTTLDRWSYTVARFKLVHDPDAVLPDFD